MDKLKVVGGKELKGSVTISSSKNSSLPLLASTLLFPVPVTFKNLPDLSDVNFFKDILNILGVDIKSNGNKTIFFAKEIVEKKAHYDLVRKMRASILILGPLLARFGEAEVSLPGGCAIGTRPIDLHLKGLSQLGATIILKNGYVKAKAEKLVGTKIHLDFPSVGATENILMASVYAEGETIIENAAMEPEIADLCLFLMKMGIKIEGIHSSTLKVYGVDKKINFPSVSHMPIPDRIEASTFIIAALITNSEIDIINVDIESIQSVLTILKAMGATFEVIDNKLRVLKHKGLKGANVMTAPYPGFPTDVQAQLMALMGVSLGESIITEKIFENRFMHVPELLRMGMNIEIDGSKAKIVGVEKLSGAPVMCTDLRASASLVLAALASKEETIISRIYHLDRGYEKMEEKLKLLGADIERIK